MISLESHYVFFDMLSFTEFLLKVLLGLEHLTIERMLNIADYICFSVPRHHLYQSNNQALYV